MVLEKTLESPLDSKEIKLVNPKENQPWIFTGRTDAEAEAPVNFGCLMLRADWLEKTLMLGKTEGRRMGATENEVVGWHHWVNGHELEQILGDSEGQGNLTSCYSPWVHRVGHDLATAHQSSLLTYLFCCYSSQVFTSFSKQLEFDYSRYQECSYLYFNFFSLYTCSGRKPAVSWAPAFELPNMAGETLQSGRSRSVKIHDLQPQSLESDSLFVSSRTFSLCRSVSFKILQHSSPLQFPLHPMF